MIVVSREKIREVAEKRRLKIVLMLWQISRHSSQTKLCCLMAQHLTTAP